MPTIGFFLIGFILYSAFYSTFIFIRNSFFKSYFLPMLGFNFLLKFILATLPPFLEDDWARYIWEGNLILKRLSPYIYTPESFFTKQDLAVDLTNLLSIINHPDWTSIYSPIVLLFFSLSFPKTYIGVKILYILLEFFSLGYMLAILGRKWTVLFLFFPLYLKEVFWNALFEILCLLCFFTAIYTLKNKRTFFLGILSGFLILIKITAFPLVARLIAFVYNKRLYQTKIIFGFLVGIVSPMLLFSILTKDFSLDFGYKNLIQFGKQFEFNFFLKHSLVDHFWIGLLFLIFPSFLLLIRILVTEKRVLNIDFVFFLVSLALVVVLPVNNAWYFLIPLPFWIVSKKRTIVPLILLSTPQLSYLTFLNLGWGFSEVYAIPDNILYIQAVSYSICLIQLNRNYSFYFTLYPIYRT